MCASTLCPLSSSTRNMALGRGSTTEPSTSIASFLATLRWVLLHDGHAPGVEIGDERNRPPPAEAETPVYGPCSIASKVGPLGRAQRPAGSASSCRARSAASGEGRATATLGATRTKARFLRNQRLRSP